MHMRRRLDVNRDDIGSRFSEALDVTLRRLDHQMNVERRRRHATEGRHDGLTDGDIRDKTPIHHVDVDIIAARSGDRPNLIGETPKVR